MLWKKSIQKAYIKMPRLIFWRCPRKQIGLECLGKLSRAVVETMGRRH